MTRLCSAAALLALPALASAQTFAFQYASGSVTPVGGVVPAINRPPAFHAGTLAFNGVPVGASNEGIYTLPLGGAVTQVARRDQAAPGGGTFTQLLATPSIYNGVVAFHGFTSAGRGIYTNLGGTLRNVVGPGATPLPGATPSGFRWGMRPSTDGQSVLFAGSDGSFSFGVYSWSPTGGIRRVVDSGTPIPSNPGEHLGPFGNVPAINSGLVAFTSYATPQGVYVADQARQVVQTVALSGTPMPGSADLFNTFSANTLAFDGSAVLFQGQGGATEGLYTNLGGTLRAVADNHTPIPGGVGNFTSFQIPPTEFGISGTSIVFTGVGSNGQKGLFGKFGQGLERIIAVGETLDGRVISDYWFGREGLDGDRLAFTVLFTDNSSAVYVANVPAPGGALVLAGLIVLRRRSRR